MTEVPNVPVLWAVVFVRKTFFLQQVDNSALPNYTII